MVVEDIQVYIDKITEKVSSWVDSFIAMIPNFFLALLVVFLTFLIARVIKNLFRRIIFKVSNNVAINNLLASFVSTTLVTIGLFIALRVLNLDKTVTSLLAGLGIVGLALGFAFKDIASNFIAGIYLAIKSPINVGDIIEFKDTMGKVKVIGLRACTINTFQGQDVIMPNRLILEDKYTHYTINQQRRIDLDVGISYADDLEKAEKVTIEAIKDISFIDRNKPVDLYYKEFGESAIIYSVRYWVHYDSDDILIYLRALSQGIKNIKKAYEAHDITITFPIRTIDFGIKGGKNLAEMFPETK